MRRPSVLKKKVSEFRSELIEYNNFLQKDKYQEATRLRSVLNVQWGELKSDLKELDIALFYQQFDKTLPIFEVALQSPDGSMSRVHFTALGMAIGELETAIGKLNRLEEEGSSIQHSFWISGLILTFIVGWLVRHYQGKILILHFSNILKWEDKKIILTALAAGFSSISVNFFTDIVRTDGLMGSIKRHPFQFIISFILGIGLLFCVGKLATTP